MDAGYTGDHRVQVWLLSSHFPRFFEMILQHPTVSDAAGTRVTRGGASPAVSARLRLRYTCRRAKSAARQTPVSVTGR